MCHQHHLSTIVEATAKDCHVDIAFVDDASHDHVNVSRKHISLNTRSSSFSSTSSIELSIQSYLYLVESMLYDARRDAAFYDEYLRTMGRSIVNECIKFNELCFQMNNLDRRQDMQSYENEYCCFHCSSY
jgi:hypothetical protein